MAPTPLPPSCRLCSLASVPCSAQIRAFPQLRDAAPSPSFLKGGGGEQKLRLTFRLIMGLWGTVRGAAAAAAAARPERAFTHTRTICCLSGRLGPVILFTFPCSPLFWTGGSHVSHRFVSPLCAPAGAARGVCVCVCLCGDSRFQDLLCLTPLTPSPTPLVTRRPARQLSGPAGRHDHARASPRPPHPRPLWSGASNWGADVCGGRSPFGAGAEGKGGRPAPPPHQ